MTPLLHLMFDHPTPSQKEKMPEKQKTLKLNIIPKRVPVQDWHETRYFVETNDGFDGTAQGYGYRSPQNIYRAYSYYVKNWKDKSITSHK